MLILLIELFIFSAIYFIFFKESFKEKPYFKQHFNKTKKNEFWFVNIKKAVIVIIK